MLENLDDPKRQALLALAAGLLSPVRGKGWSGFGEALGQGINSGLLGMNAAQRTQEATRRGEMDRKLEQERLAQIQKAREAQEYMGAGIKQFMQPGVTPATPVDDSGFAMPSSQPGFDRSGFAQYLAQNPATAEKALGFMPQPEAPARPMVVGKALVDPRTGKPIYTEQDKPLTREIKSGRRIITQESLDGGKTWKQVAISDMDKPDSGQRSAPPGYEWAPDGNGLRPIPGGPADAKVGKEADAAAARDKAAAGSAEFVISQVKKAKDQAKKGWFATGATGKVMRNIGGTDAFDLSSTVDSIKANIGFDTLAEMRRNSPTGGALGQVAVQELNMLQAARGALDTAQSEAQFLEALDGIEKHYKGWLSAVEQSKKPSGGASGSWSIERVQ